MITWGDVVEIIKCVFDINQTQLAKTMKCDKSAITGIKQGERAPSFENDQLFSFVFDPATPDSPANKGKRTPQYWLDLLKEEIESNFKEVREAMEDCWDEKDYRTFVLTLLDRARRGPPTEKRVLSTIDCDIISETPDVDNDNHHKKQEEASIIETPTEQMRKIFEQAVVDWNIASHTLNEQN